MPSAAEILAGMQLIANQWLVAAVVWHVVIAIALGALAAEAWRPSARAFALCAALPLASVAVFAALAANPFNSTVLGLGTVAMVGIASRIETTQLAVGPRWAFVLGLLMIAFGWFYPHFLVSRPAWYYTFASPLGLVPCPTLSFVIGIGLCAGGFRSRAWALVAGSLGLFYGVFGVLRLGVWLDLPLIAGAVAMLVLAARVRAPRPSTFAGRESYGAP